MSIKDEIAGASDSMIVSIVGKVGASGALSNNQSHGYSKELAERFSQNYPRFQYVFVEFIVDHLTDVSRQFNGDIQRALVLAVIGQRTIQRNEKQQGAEGMNASSSSGMTASRIADVTGIPRETVRRKLKSLEALGWIRRVEGSAYELAVQDGVSKAREDLGEIDRRGIDRAARLISSLRGML